MPGDGRHLLPRLVGAPLAALLAISPLAAAPTVESARELSKQGDYQGAEAAYREILEAAQSPKVQHELAVVLYNQALLAGRKKQFEETLKPLREALILSPDLKQARLALILSYDRLGNDTEAARQLALLGERELAAGSPDSALVAFQEASKRVPADPRYLVGQGDAFFAKQDYHGALEVYRKAAKKPAKGPGLHRRMGDAYLKLGLKKAALSAYEEADRLDPTPATSVFLSGTYSEMGAWDKAAAKAREALDKGFKRDGRVAFLLANSLYRKGLEGRQSGAAKTVWEPSLDAALLAVDKGIEVANLGRLHLLKALILLLLDREHEAIADLSEAIEKAPEADRAELRKMLAKIYEKTGEPAKAAEVRSGSTP